MGSRNHVLDVGQDWTDPFAVTRGDKSAINPLAKLLWTLLLLILAFCNNVCVNRE